MIDPQANCKNTPTSPSSPQCWHLCNCSTISILGNWHWYNIVNQIANPIRFSLFCNTCICVRVSMCSSRNRDVRSHASTTTIKHPSIPKEQKNPRCHPFMFALHYFLDSCSLIWSYLYNFVIANMLYKMESSSVKSLRLAFSY